MPSSDSRKARRVEDHRNVTLQFNGDILGSGVAASTIRDGKVTAALYGRNGVGKTTFACQGEGPICLLAIDPAPSGGARSVMRPDVGVYQVAARHLPEMRGGEPTGQMEAVKGSEKVLAICEAIAARSRTGPCPFKKVVVDGLTSWNDIILSEILGIEYAKMPAILGLGKVSGDQYTERSERMMRYLKVILDLPCDVWILAQEKDHNPPKTTTISKSGKEHTRPTQSRFMAEAHPAAQEGSFWSFAVGDSAALFVQNACDFVMQLYEDEELVEQKKPDMEFNGQLVVGETILVQTGQRVKRLRCKYHTNYSARFRGDYRVIPEYIEAPTPEDRYQAFLDVVAGRKTKWGKYNG